MPEIRENLSGRGDRIRRRLRLVAAAVIAVAFVAVLVAIVGWPGASAPRRTAATTTAAAADAGERQPRGFLDQFDVTDLRIAPKHLRRGGPPKDGIPALRDPRTTPVSRARFLLPKERVVGVSVNGRSRAYPLSVLNWHEIVNDTLGGVAIAVIYCPLCDSVSVLDRRLGGKTMEFGVSGLLYNSNVIPYDRTDQALWSQVGVSAISGPSAGGSLRHLPFELVSFQYWKQRHLKSTVITAETGYRRDYGRNPYAGYFRTGRVWFPLTRRDSRLKPKARVVGVRVGKLVRAYPLSALRQAPAGRVRQPFPAGDLILQAVGDEGQVRILALPKNAAVVHTFWFAWAAIHPETTIWRYPHASDGRTSQPS